MPVPLDHWQQRLERHFSQLAESRPVAGFPIFALEHGLQKCDLQEIGELLRAQVRARLPLRPHRLVWVIYAAELGYGYDGQEYWQSFEDQTPRWKEQGTGRQLRGWFSDFQKAYGGIIPSGPWAEHFSIIAWPITHAILPRDLQGQFARHLYNLRFELARLVGSSVAEVGEFLKARSPGGSSRFENLLEQTSLTGRLVHALSQQESDAGIPAIYPATLSRITADLEERQNSRDWLRDARSVLRDARVRAGTSLAPGRGAVDAKSQTQQGRTSVGLVGRQSAAGEWTLGVAYPDIEAILQAIGVPAAALDHASVILVDRPDLSMPAQALLSVSQRERAIQTLKDIVDKPLATLKPAVPRLSEYLANLRIPASSLLLLRLQADGIARLVRGNHVRAGQTYLLVATAPVAERSIQDLGLRIQQSRTAAVTIYLLEVPDQLGRYYLDALARLNIGHSLRTTIEPVGLVPRWDAAADATVWLANEELILRLSSDAPVRNFTLGVNGAGWTSIPASHGSETMVSLGSLPLGRHVIEVRATADGQVSARGDERLEPEQLSIHVRPPLPWAEGVRQQAGFRVLLSPGNAPIADLVSGAARLEIHGPPDRPAIVAVESFDSNGHFAERALLGHVTLPASPHAMHQIAARLGQEPVSELVQSSPRIDISIAIEELGRGFVSLRQKIDPLRWKLQTISGRACARLIDEAGAEEDVSVDRYNIGEPGKRVPILRQDCLGGLALNSPGALLTAKFDGRRYSAVVSVPGKLTTFADLGITIAVGTTQDTVRAIRRLIPLYRLWMLARPLGSLAPLRKKIVLNAIDNKIACLACGTDWTARLQIAVSGTSTLLDRLQREVGGSRGFAYRMRTTDWRRPGDGLKPLDAFRQWAVATYKITDDAELASLAFRLAFEPSKVRFDPSDQSVQLLIRLGQIPELARGAYLARAMRDRQSQELLSGEAA